MQRAPAWIGIGAQRSGTTWLTRLLLRHPAVCLAPSSNSFLLRKELHFFDEVLHSGFDDSIVGAYQRLFAEAESSHPGEFTPSYLRCTWVAGPLRRAVSADTILVCILRDPVERFYSAVRWSRHLKDTAGDLYRLFEHRGGWSRLVGGDALWGGMYATQLRAWARLFHRDQLIVLQYEAAVQNPAGAARAVWEAMGLAPVDIGPAQQVSETTSPQDEWALQLARIPELRAQLRSVYRPEVRRLARDWGIDPELWTSSW